MLPLILVSLFGTLIAQQWTYQLINFKACVDTIDRRYGEADWYWEPDFEEHTRVYNLEYQSAPLLYWRSYNTTGVSRVLACADTYGVVATARSGGHSYGGFSRGQSYGLIVDLAYLNDIAVSEDRTTAWLGAGNRIGRVMQELHTQASVFFPPASGPTVGLGGYILGGGQGVFSRKYGYASDSVLALEAVLATGQVVEASPFRYQDLFWAMRGGGGGNFAIATKYKVRVYDSSQTVSLRATTLPLLNLGDVVRGFTLLSNQQPDVLGGYLAISTESGILINLVCVCDKDTLADYTKDFAALLPASELQLASDNLFAIWKNVTSVLTPNNNTVDDTDLNYPPNFKEQQTYTALKSVFLAGEGALDSRVGQYLIDAISHVPYNSTAVANVELVGGAMRKESTIYPSAIYNRDITLLFELTLQSNSPLTPLQTKWLDTVYGNIQGLIGNYSYINLIDPTIANPGTAYYGTNLDPLKQVAETYDPNNTFDFPMAIRRLQP